jgi:hypothetical protein
MMSAKTGEGVAEAFLEITGKIIKTMPKVEERKMMSLELKEAHDDGERRNAVLRCCPR